MPPEHEGAMLVAVSSNGEDVKGSAMRGSKDEREAAEWFREHYGRGPTDAARMLERGVIGEDFGASGYTTAAQADLLVERLGLHEGDRLLDLGSGQGWPGLDLAKVTGSSVVLTDLPEEGLRTAMRRALLEGIADRSGAVVASARRLPLASDSFDAIVHTDVLC
jgi:2-polyprenyl-3-methyl-5-hydroxy-6-metoxy-1,4-benzoquinol methylase